MMICPKCSYSWTPLVAAPKACPRCKTRLDYLRPGKQVEVLGDRS